jgi:hypothetical protein
MNLETLLCLRSIVNQLSDSYNKSLSRAVIIRRNEFGEALIDAALNYGNDNNILEWRAYNMIHFLKDFIVPEEAYYDSFQAVLASVWASDPEANLTFNIENTSRQNSKIAGPWTRPDFTLVSQKKYAWTIGYEFDVVTYEVKRSDTCNVLAVFEALSHLSVATRAYVVFPVPRAKWETENPAQAKRVHDECLRHGIGLIFIDVGNGMKAEHAIRAPRREIDYERCNSFLSAVISIDGKNKIASWKT